MCVIIGTKGKKKINEKVLRDAWESNSDGAGLAWQENKKVYVIKGIMKLKELIEIYEEVDTFPHVVHFRLGTGGGTCPELTHPFPCSPKKVKNEFIFEADSVVFHNGIISGWETLLFALSGVMEKKEYQEFVKQPLNDTKVVAKYIEKTCPEILNYLGGKWCYMTGKETTLFGEGWIQEEEFFYSNKSFEYKNVTTYYRGGGNWFGQNNIQSLSQNEEEEEFGSFTRETNSKRSLWREFKERYAK